MTGIHAVLQPLSAVSRHLIQRAGIWHYYRRVPARFADVDPRTFVLVSLETRDLRRAERLKPRIEREVEAYWLALKRGESDQAFERYRGAVERARLEGFEYRSVADLAAGEIDELIARLERLREMGGTSPAARPDGQAAAALLGGLEAPQLTLSKGLERFFDLTRDQVRSKSPDQLRRWKATRTDAVDNLIALVGDKALTGTTRADALAFRAWWTDRVIEEGMSANSANKQLGHLGQMFDTLNEMLELGIGRPFAKLRLEDNKKTQRAAFADDYLRELVRDPTKLAGLNDEARNILYAMVETGLRPVEICGLDPEDIVLDGDVPHVKIRPKANRELKTAYSERDMPLVGISLEAFEAFPGGFPRYRDKSSSLSAVVNKFLTERGLLPTERHTLYSIRHTFQDRLNRAGIVDRYQVDLMGHKFGGAEGRPKYGEGQTLKEKLELLQRLLIT